MNQRHIFQAKNSPRLDIIFWFSRRLHWTRRNIKVEINAVKDGYIYLKCGRLKDADAVLLIDLLFVYYDKIYRKPKIYINVTLKLIFLVNVKKKVIKLRVYLILEQINDYQFH